MSAVKIIAVTGATGAQGGGVVNIMKKTPGWRVRAVTRNPESEAAKKLAADGSVEVVRADWNDEESLVRAFEVSRRQQQPPTILLAPSPTAPGCWSAHQRPLPLQGVAAVFAVTNWWESLFAGKSQWESGDIEERHGMNLARAAAKTPSLEHYLWSTQPSAKRVFPGKLETPHMDYKANVDARIKAELPELARKTTYLYFGYYPQNMAYFPLIKPFEYVSFCVSKTWPRPRMLTARLPLSSPEPASSSRYWLPTRRPRFFSPATWRSTRASGCVGSSPRVRPRSASTQTWRSRGGRSSR